MSLEVQWLRLHAFTAGVTGSILGHRTQISHASWSSQKINQLKINSSGGGDMCTPMACSCCCMTETNTAL